MNFAELERFARELSASQHLTIVGSHDRDEGSSPTSQQNTVADEATQLREALKELAHNLDGAKKILAAAAGSSRDAVSIWPLVHENVGTTLEMINTITRAREGDGGTSRITSAHSYKNLLRRVAVDNLKLKAFLRTLNLQHANILPPCDADELNHRADRIRTYVDTEIWLHKTSHTRRREEDSDTKQKWEALHEIDYLRLITENHPTSKLEWTLTHHLHAAAQYLDAISRSGESTQWLNCLLCKYHMSASSRCAECNADVQAKNKKVYQFGLTVEDYVTQLDMELLDVLHRLSTSTYIRNKNDILRNFKSELHSPGFTGREQEPSMNFLTTIRTTSHTTSTEKEGEEMQASLNSPHRGLLLRRHLDGPIRIEPRPKDLERVARNGDVAPFLGDLPKIDLRFSRLKPLYAKELDGSKCWEISIVPNNPLSSNHSQQENSLLLPQKIPFRKLSAACQFQHSVTGYHVSGDFGPSVGILTHRKHGSQEFSYCGRLQFWEHKPHQQIPTQSGPISPPIGAPGPPVGRSRTGMSSMSVSSYSSTANAHLKSARVSTINKNGTGIFLIEPEPPFIVLIVETSNNPEVLGGDILAFGVRNKAEIDESKCQCYITGSECPSSILFHPRPVILELQHGSVPKYPECKVHWIKISFPEASVRKRFVIELEGLREIYRNRLQTCQEDMTNVLQGHVETRDFKDR